jgi:predicted DNA-binding antitoxin AbrB/MazE fold protein
MNKYRTLEPITLRGVVLLLEGDQLRRRLPLVEAVDADKGLFKPIAEVQFKAGEVVVTRDPLPKAFWGKVEALQQKSSAKSEKEEGGEEPHLQEDAEEEKKGSKRGQKGKR